MLVSLFCRCLPCYPSSRHSHALPKSVDSTLSSDGDTSSSSTALLSANASNNSSRISAVRELIETEQRYVDDLRTVASEFIGPLRTNRVLSDLDVEQMFINWHHLIARNNVLLKALHGRVDYKPDSVVARTPRSASMSNIAMAPQLPAKSIIDHRHRSFTPEVSQSSSTRRLKHRRGTDLHSPTGPAATDSPAASPMPFVPSSGSMTITELTRIGQVLCDHLPTMADDYFQYCNCRAQANKSLQTKMDSDEQFRAHLQVFQERTGGLSLNGFLTKPIQRVTRYPLLIDKILKHTSVEHADYHLIKRALECARQLNERINKQISEQESSGRLDWLQQHLTFGSDENCADGYLFDELLRFNSLNRYQQQRQLLLHGLVLKVPGGKELLTFLFNDFLLFSTIKSSSSQWQAQLFEQKSNLQLKLYRMPLMLTDVIIANDALNDQLTFSITTKVYDKPLLLKTQQSNVRTLWVKTINHAVEECQAAEKSILTDRAVFTMTDHQRDSKAAVARLLLVVLEAHDLMPSPTTLERHRSVDPYCEITVGPLTLKTAFAKRTVKPKWNAPMQFLVYNLQDDVIHINVADHEFFSPNENLGTTSVPLVDLLPTPLDIFLSQPSLPFTKQLFLNNGSSVAIRCVVQLLSSSQ